MRKNEAVGPRQEIIAEDRFYAVLGEMVRGLREELGMTLDEFAQWWGVARTKAMTLERGKARLDMAEIASLDWKLEREGYDFQFFRWMVQPAYEHGRQMAALRENRASRAAALG